VELQRVSIARRWTGLHTSLYIVDEWSVASPETLGLRRCFFLADSDMVSLRPRERCDSSLLRRLTLLFTKRVASAPLAPGPLPLSIAATTLRHSSKKVSPAIADVHRPTPKQLHTTMSDSDTEAGVPLIEAEFDSLASSKKRKREAEEGTTPESKKAAKKAKRKQKKKLKVKDIDEDDLDQAMGVNRAFEKMDAQLLADYVNARTRLYGKELSSVELEDRFVPSMGFLFFPGKIVYLTRKQHARSRTRRAIPTHGPWTTSPHFSRSSANTSKPRLKNLEEHPIRSWYPPLGNELPMSSSPYEPDCQSRASGTRTLPSCSPNT
jgi:hypothetical protein